MMNYPDAVSITARGVRSVDAETGVPVTSDVDVCTQAPCAFAVLSATEKEQAWGNGTLPSTVPTVSASLVMPRGGPELDAELSNYVVRVAGHPGTWRVVSERPGRDWSTYLLSR